MEVEAPNHPKDPAMGTRTIPLTKSLYIERDDFRLQDSKDYYGLAPGKSVILRYAVKITHKATITDPATGEVVGLEVEASEIDTSEKKAKNVGVIHWISDPYPGKRPLAITLRMFENLFNSADVNEVDDYLTDLNPASMATYQALGESFLGTLAPETPVQFERVGFFVPDKETAPGRVVYNRTVTLYEGKDVKKIRSN